jgi:hypothetical protein
MSISADNLYYTGFLCCHSNGSLAELVQDAAHGDVCNELGVWFMRLACMPKSCPPLTLHVRPAIGIFCIAAALPHDCRKGSPFIESIPELYKA